MHDARNHAFGNQYFPIEIFDAWSGKKMSSFRGMVAEGCKYDVVILSHINLLPIAYAIKKISPGVKVVMFAHGIEVWNRLSRFKRKLLLQCDMVWAVSGFTRDRLIEGHAMSDNKIKVLNNPLDPFLPLPQTTGAGKRRQLGVAENKKVLFTLTRLNSGEKYKGYDQVLKAISLMNKSKYNIQYVIGGKYDEAEKERVLKLADELQLQDQVLLTGFIADEDLPAYFNMADLYVMPSREEGFGIVFIEAMYYGLPVIAGNVDGSSDALLHGKLGRLVNPLNVEEIADAIAQVLNDPQPRIAEPKDVLANFGYESYKRKFNNYLKELVNAG